MSFEYIIDYACQVRKELGDNANETMISAARAKGTYLALKHAMLLEDPSIDIDNQVISEHTITPIGGEPRELMMGDLKHQFIDFNHFIRYCAICPCKFGRDQPESVLFGCYSSIKYPISEKFEELIVRCAVVVMNDAMDREPGLFLKYIFDHPDIVTRIQGLRNNDGEFLETDEPFVVITKNNERILDSDQLISMLLGFEIDPKYAKFVFLPFIDIISNYYYKNLKEGEEVDTEKNEITSDKSLREVVRFGEAIRTAMGVDCRVLTQL